MKHKLRISEFYKLSREQRDEYARDRIPILAKERNPVGVVFLSQYRETLEGKLSKPESGVYRYFELVKGHKPTSYTEALELVCIHGYNLQGRIALKHIRNLLNLNGQPLPVNERELR